MRALTPSSATPRFIKQVVTHFGFNLGSSAESRFNVAPQAGMSV